MRKLTMALVACTILLAPALLADEWVGWISDEHCAGKGANDGHASCAIKCADGGAALVFVNEADKQVFKLDDQKAAKELAGKKVKVTGKIEESTIKVESIAEAPKAE